MNSRYFLYEIHCIIFLIHIRAVVNIKFLKMLGIHIFIHGHKTKNVVMAI